VRTHAGDWHISLTGEIELSNVPEAEPVLRLAQGDATTVWLDLNGISFIDSSGIAMLVRAQRRAKGQSQRGCHRPAIRDRAAPV
jgi:anti-anti-sigma factor